MANETPSKPSNMTWFRTAAYNTFRIFFLLIVVSRIYAILIAFGLVPNYPDPILAFLSSSYYRFNLLLEQGYLAPSSASAEGPANGSAGKTAGLIDLAKALHLPGLIVGNLVFGGMLRYYSSPPDSSSASALTSEEKETDSSTPLSKKKAKKQGSLLKQVQQEQEEEAKGKALKNLADTKKKVLEKNTKQKENDARDLKVKRNIVIFGRLSQCAIFLYAGLTSDVSALDRKVAGVSVRRLRPILDSLISVGIVFAELNHVPWDAGVLDMLFDRAKAEDEEVVAESGEGDGVVKLR